MGFCVSLATCAAMTASVATEAGSPPGNWPSTMEAIGRQLKAAYPDAIRGVDGNRIAFFDGSHLPLSDGGPAKSFADWLDHPDIKDTFAIPYSAGPRSTLPHSHEQHSNAELKHDPGRARNVALLTKLYGDCRRGTVQPDLVDVAWLPGQYGKAVKMSSRHGAAKALERVSLELDRLGPDMAKFLLPPAGGFNCRLIAGTKTPSAHGFGIAIDIATRHAKYWRWDREAANAKKPAAPRDRTAIPDKIVEVFERHGFIWGGRWHHYDTMHFEYRPELNPPPAP